MTDEQAETTDTTPNPKRRPGRPKGSTSKRRTERRPMHRGRDRDDLPDRVERYEFFPFEARDKFFVQKEVTDTIERDWGMKLCWFALEIAGKPNEFIAARRRNQWEEVRAGDFEGQLDYLGVKDGIICIESVALFRQPIEIYRKAVAYERRQAAGAITNMRRSHAEEGVGGVSMPGGAEHPSALQKNRHKTSYEPGPKIPE
jgi:hypothetical protein